MVLAGYQFIFSTAATQVVRTRRRYHGGLASTPRVSPSVLRISEYPTDPKSRATLLLQLAAVAVAQREKPVGRQQCINL
jgi:hypothetical protein